MEDIVSSSYTDESSAAQSSCVSVGVSVSTVCESSAAMAVDVCDGEGYCSSACLPFSPRRDYE